jgi:uncharacterized cupredoxin-like copper-binding protein
MVFLCAALAILAFAACTSVGGGEEIPVVADENGGRMSFEPKVINVAPGQEVTFVVKNEGDQDHEFESDEAGIEEVIIPAGRERRVNWTAPSRPATFPVYCDLPGHREAGMELSVGVGEQGAG